MQESEWINEIKLYDNNIKFIKANDKAIGIHQPNGLLKVLMVYSRGDNRGSYYYCECDCGNRTTVWGSHFRTEHSKSCGCYSKEKSRESMYKLIEKKKENNTFYKDLTGKTHGWLIALEPTDKVVNRLRIWKCKCLLCNSICEKDSVSFSRSLSCGCIIQSGGVQKIEELLNINNIPYIKEKRFDSCRDKNPLPFDFYINNKYLIEFDGIQHFKDIKLWDGKDKLIERQKHDEIKNKWCKENNIPLIRIPYTAFEILNINDLLLETSQYKIK